MSERREAGTPPSSERGPSGPAAPEATPRAEEPSERREAGTPPSSERGPRPVVGLLFDFPRPDGGTSFAAALTAGLDAVGAPAVELRSVEALGHPSAPPTVTADAYDELATGTTIVVGPSISDNAAAVLPRTDARAVPAVNYTGGERTRGPWMFHYQVGSLGEEPHILAGRLAHRGLRRVALVRDDSIVGEGYEAAFAWAARLHGIDVVAAATVAPMAARLGSTVATVLVPEPDALVYLGLGTVAYALAGALADRGASLPVVANSALMFGYARRDWRDAWRGWEYVDTVADDNRERARLAAILPRVAAGPIGCAAYDIGRLVGTALLVADDHSPTGVASGLERVKQLAAASGHEGTTMGFGPYDRGALKGRYLVLREWRDGRSMQVDA